MPCMYGGKVMKFYIVATLPNGIYTAIKPLGDEKIVTPGEFEHCLGDLKGNEAIATHVEEGDPLIGLLKTFYSIHHNPVFMGFEL